MTKPEKARVSVIIPTRNAAETLPALLERLQSQTLRPNEIFVVDSASTDGTVKLAEDCPGVRVLSIERAAFDHGGTRDMALRQTVGEFVCFLTQDALPEDDGYLAALLAPFADERVGAVCGRQMARSDALPEEKLTRAFNYPADSFTRDQGDRARLGIKTYFLSDACSAYRRSAYLVAGGFEHPIETNEDMLMAARLIAGGWRIAYSAEAAVLHSHRFSLRQDYQRSWRIGAFLACYATELGGASANSEGMRYVAFVSKALLRHGRVVSFARFGLHCVARYLGSRAGGKAVGKGKPR